MTLLHVALVSRPHVPAGLSLRLSFVAHRGRAGARTCRLFKGKCSGCRGKVHCNTARHLYPDLCKHVPPDNSCNSRRRPGSPGTSTSAVRQRPAWPLLESQTDAKASNDLLLLRFARSQYHLVAARIGRIALPDPPSCPTRDRASPRHRSCSVRRLSSRPMQPPFMDHPRRAIPAHGPSTFLSDGIGRR